MLLKVQKSFWFQEASFTFSSSLTGSILHIIVAQVNVLFTYLLICSWNSTLQHCLIINLQSHHIPQWRRVAMIFVEIIRHAPRYFNIQSDSEGTLAALDNVRTCFTIIIIIIIIQSTYQNFMLFYLCV